MIRGYLFIEAIEGMVSGKSERGRKGIQVMERIKKN